MIVKSERIRGGFQSGYTVLKRAVRYSSRAAGGLVLLAGIAGATHGARAEDFYKGKDIRLVVSSGAGGAYDLYARMLATVYGKHIPGNPKFIVQNVPGAGGIKATNYMYTQAPRDGTVIAATHSGIETAPLRLPTVAKFDLNKFSWIGSITSDPFVGYVWHTTPVKTLEETKTTPIIVGGISVGTAGLDFAVIARDILGLNLKIVAGYKGSGDVKLAMTRGEVQGTFANGWSSLKSQEPDWLKDGKIRILVQHGLKKSADLPNVPRLIDFARNDMDRQAVTFMAAIQEAAKPYFGPPAIPTARLEELRRGFDASIRDPKFVAGLKRTHAALTDPMTGAELAAFVKNLSETPPAVVARVNKALDDFKNKKQKKSSR